MPGDAGEMVTYSNPNGGLVAGEYSWVTDLEFFDDECEPTRLRRQRWVCVEDEVGDYWPADLILCDICEGEGTIVGVECVTCAGSGEHPMRGAGFVLRREDTDAD